MDRDLYVWGGGSGNVSLFFFRSISVFKKLRRRRKKALLPQQAADLADLPDRSTRRASAVIFASQPLDQHGFRRIVLSMASTTRSSRFTAGFSRCPRTELATVLINLTTALGVPVTMLIIRCGRDWVAVHDATTAAQWMFPGAETRTDFAARTADAAQAAERTHHEQIRQCVAVHRMSADQHRLYAAPKDASFDGPLPPRWLGVPPLYLTDTQLGGRPLPIGVTERVSGAPAECLRLLADAGVIELR